MSRIICAATLAIAAITVSAETNGQKKVTAPDFPPRANLRAEALKEFDKDGDGKLSDAERQAMIEARKAMGEKMRQAREKEFDKDGDGKLSDAERQAMMEARKAQMDKLMKEREKEFDKDGDGKLNDAERQAMMEKFKQRHPDAGARFQEMLKRFDKDGDGKLSDAERKAMMEARTQEMQGVKKIAPENKAAEEKK